jgi:ketosteroid isomerase-like protein
MRRLDYESDGTLHAISLVMILAVVLLNAACSQPDSSETDTSAEETVRQLAMDWAAAEASNDIDAALSYMWDDAVMQPPNAPQIEGHDAIRDLYETVTFYSLEVGPLTVKVGGDLAAVWGPLNYALDAPGGPIKDQAKFVAIWERRGDEWKVLENSWNSNLPAAGVESSGP